ncbi:hypothetical protein [Nonomuraea guangzhouensis]|uniref:Uncharacterized protein n=1 Tax=Nonomuraea guangzhouensis TaxID=1291555 RepID=A0ABW4GXH7_9ACTN
MDENVADEAWWRRQAAAQGEWWRKRAAGQQEETLRQNNLMYGGLIAIGVVLVQPFLTPGVMLNRHETYRRRMTSSVVVLVAQQAALGLGYVGVVAGFWHIMTIAGIAILVGTILGLAVHSAGYVRVEEDDAQATPGAEQPPPL